MSKRRPPARTCIEPGCDRQTKSASGVCLTCQKGDTTGEGRQPVKTCLSCAAPTASADRHCPICSANYLAAATFKADDVPAADVLTGGRWVTGSGGIKRWEPEPVAKPIRRPRRKPGPKLKPLACGTERGYHQHRTRGPWPLDPSDNCGCLAAHRDHVSRKYHERKGREELAAATQSMAREVAA